MGAGSRQGAPGTAWPTWLAVALFPPENLYSLWVAQFYDDGTQADYEPDVRVGHFFVGKRRLSLDLLSPYSPTVYDVLHSMVAKVPEIATWELDFDNSLDSTVGEYLEMGRPSEDGELPPVLFHGTSTAVLDDIMRRGIAPRDVTGSVPVYGAEGTMEGIGVGHAGRIYLASGYALGSAKYAARSAARMLGGDAVILAVDADALDHGLLRPDEDSGSNDWIASVWRTGTLAYEGTVQPKAISLAFRLNTDPDGGRLWEKIA